ncbi:Extracellular serine proteinase [Streptomyces sp. enrichment culture]
MDRVTANAVKPALADMSLGGGADSTLDAAVRNSIASGVTHAITAGNGNQGGKARDTREHSPARVPEVLTVGATDKTDTKAPWPDHGTCLGLFAPGAGITSAWNTGDSATPAISGTSRAPRPCTWPATPRPPRPRSVTR